MLFKGHGTFRNKSGVHVVCIIIINLWGKPCLINCFQCHFYVFCRVMTWSSPKRSHGFWGVLCGTLLGTHTPECLRLNLISFLPPLFLSLLPVLLSSSISLHLLLFLALSPSSFFSCGADDACMCVWHKLPRAMVVKRQLLVWVLTCHPSETWSFGCLPQWRLSYLWASWVLPSWPAISPRKRWEYREYSSIWLQGFEFRSLCLHSKPFTYWGTPAVPPAFLLRSLVAVGPVSLIKSSFCFFLHLLEWKEILVARPLRPLWSCFCREYCSKFITSLVLYVVTCRK